MLKRAVISVVLLSIGVGVCAAQGNEQAKPEPKFYRFDLVVKEVEDGRVSNARTYSTIGATTNDGAPSVRTGSRVPVVKAGGEFTYLDVGVNIDYRAIKDLGDSVGLVASVEVSSIASSDTASANTTVPVIRQNRWSSAVVIPLRKATNLFSSDDLTSKGKVEVELTATPLKP